MGNSWKHFRTMDETRIAGLLVGAGVLVRLLFLGKRQLWTDELIQAVLIRTDSVWSMLREIRTVSGGEAPLDYFIQKGVVLFLGDSAWSLRLHSVLLGGLSLWCLFRIARRMFGHRVALFALFLMVFFPLHFHFSQEARPDALLVLMTLLSYDLLLGIIADGYGRWHRWGLLGVVLILLLYSSSWGVFVLLSQGLALGISAAMKPGDNAPLEPDEEVRDIAPARWTSFLLYSGLALFAIAAFIPWLQFAWATPGTARILEAPGPKVVLRLIKEVGDNSYPMSGFLMLGVITGIRVLRRHSRRQALTWLLSWAFCSIPIILLVELRTGGIFTIRHFLHVTPALVLLAAYGLSYVGEQLTILERLPYRLSSPALAYAAMMVIFCGWIAQNHWRSEPVDWKGTATYLQQTLRPGDQLAMPSVGTLVEYYAPELAVARVEGFNGSLAVSRGYETQRRFVACCHQAYPDPCARFRQEVLGSGGWQKTELRGFTIFMHEPGR